MSSRRMETIGKKLFGSLSINSEKIKFLMLKFLYRHKSEAREVDQEYKTLLETDQIDLLASTVQPKKTKSASQYFTPEETFLIKSSNRSPQKFNNIKSKAKEFSLRSNRNAQTNLINEEKNYQQENSSDGILKKSLKAKVNLSIEAMTDKSMLGKRDISMSLEPQLAVLEERFVSEGNKLTKRSKRSTKKSLVDMRNRSPAKKGKKKGKTVRVRTSRFDNYRFNLKDIQYRQHLQGTEKTASLFNKLSEMVLDISYSLGYLYAVEI